jgi:hypothetical protein
VGFLKGGQAMGDAADDLFDAAMKEAEILALIERKGIKACPRTPHHFKTDDECPVCADAGWIDANGNPCEL